MWCICCVCKTLLESKISRLNQPNNKEITVNLSAFVQLAQAGSAGIAIVCLLMSYRLLSEINRQPSTQEALAVLQEKNRSARYYMGFSVSCLILALLGLYFEHSFDQSRSGRIRIVWTPNEKPKWLSAADEIIPKAVVSIKGEKKAFRSDKIIEYPEDGLIMVDYQAFLDYVVYLPQIQASYLNSKEAGVD